MESTTIIPRGCTCRNSFDFPNSQEEVATLFITYQQNKLTKFEKDLSECTFSDGKVRVNLSQEQTLSLEEGIPIMIQIRAKLRDGTAIKSDIQEAYTDKVLKEGVI